MDKNQTAQEWNERIGNLSAACQGALSEMGTTTGQDYLLFACGFTDELSNAHTTDGSSVDLKRDDYGRVTGKMPMRSLKHYAALGQTHVVVEGIGWVELHVPDEDELLDDKLAQEVSALNQLPAWAKDAVKAEFKRRELADAVPVCEDCGVAH